MNNQVNVFRELHKNKELLLLANAWDAASAKIVELSGGKAVATTSAGVAWSMGYPDGHQLPSNLQTDLARNINRVLNVPLSMDVENGYSNNPSQVAENIKPLLDAGIAGINIEDGNDNPDLLASKIEAIRNVVAKAGTDLFINARTDVYLAGLVSEEESVNEVIDRAKVYANAGADGLFVPFLSDADEIKKIVSGTNLPLNVMMVPDLPNLEMLNALGVKRLSAGSGISQIMWNQFFDLSLSFLKHGNFGKLENNPMDFEELQDLFE